LVAINAQKPSNPQLVPISLHVPPTMPQVSWFRTESPSAQQG
jgi:hypothetical protein